MRKHYVYNGEQWAEITQAQYYDKVWSNRAHRTMNHTVVMTCDCFPHNGVHDAHNWRPDKQGAPPLPHK